MQCTEKQKKIFGSTYENVLVEIDIYRIEVPFIKETTTFTTQDQSIQAKAGMIFDPRKKSRTFS